MTHYGFRKIYTSSRDGVTAITPTIGSTVMYDPSIYYDMMTLMFGYEGLLVVDGNGGEGLLDGDVFIALSYEDEDLVINSNTPAVTKFKILATSPSFDSNIKQFLVYSDFSPMGACWYAQYSGDFDNVINQITDQQSMTFWVQYVRASDHDRFAPYIVDQEWIYSWATDGHDDSFFPKITDQQLLFSYSRFYRDRASWVKDKITAPYWVTLWNQTYPDDQIPDDQIIYPTPTPDPTVTPTPSDQT